MSPSQAGLPSNKGVRIAWAIARHAEHNSTGTKLGSVQLISNPAEASEVGFTFGNDLGAHAGDYYSNLSPPTTLFWITSQGAFQINPSVNRNSRSIVDIGKRTATSEKVCCDLLGMMVEYGPPYPNTAWQEVIR
jgi:hypothetical protein